jgi:hypothetical protein
MRLPLAVTVAAYLAAACAVRTPPGDHGLSDRIADHIHQTPDKPLDFAALAPFHWTRLFIFSPSTSEAAAERRLGFDWPYEWGAIEYQDDRALLVFVDSGRVVAAFEQPNERGNFMSAGRLDGFSRDSARFSVIRQGMLGNDTPNNVVVWHP